MDEGEKQRRRRTPFDQANDVASRLITFLGQRTLLSPLAGLGPIVLTVFGVIFLFAFLIILTQGGVGVGIPGGPTPSPTPAPIAGIPPGGGGSTYFAQCTFYGRSGEMKIGNPELAKFVADVADKVGVPSSVLAGILRIESPSKFSTIDPSVFQNDYDATRSDKGAIGFMQFVPKTFEWVFKINKEELQQKFSKTTVQPEIEPQITPPPSDEAMRITSIKDSIIMAAFMVKWHKNSKAGSTLNWDESAVKYVAEKYHGACPYPDGGSYCDDLWRSVQRCELSTIAAITPLIDTISAVCPTGVKSENVDACINSIPTTINRVNEVREKIRESVRGAGALQCIGFVQSLFPLLNYPDLERRVFPNEYLNPSYSSSKYTKIGPDVMQQGDVAVWAPNTGGSSNNGHFAFVTATQKDKGFFTVAEANWCYDPDPKLSLPPECGKVALRNVLFGTTSPTALFRKNQ